jgi:hypothetical protein
MKSIRETRKIHATSLVPAKIPVHLGTGGPIFAVERLIIILLGQGICLHPHGFIFQLPEKEPEPPKDANFGK